MCWLCVLGVGMHAHVVCRVGGVEWVCWGPKLQCHVHTEQLTKGLLVLLRWLLVNPHLKLRFIFLPSGGGGGTSLSHPPVSATFLAAF